MRALWLMLAFSSACWRQDDFRSKCILADNCGLPEEDAGVDAGLSPGRWNEVASLLFDVPPEVDAGFDVLLISNLSAATTTGDACAYVGGVLTKEGSVLCIPSASTIALEYSAEGRVSSATVNQRDGEGWAGGVLLESGAVVGIPTGASTLLSIATRPPLPGRQVDFLPLSDVPDAGAGFGAAARTLDGTIVTVDGTHVVFIRDGGVARAAHQQSNGFAGAVLTESGRTVLLSPREATRVIEATPRTLTTQDRATVRGGMVSAPYAGGLLLETGDALLMPAAAGAPFLRVPADGGAPVPTTAVARASLFGAVWSTNGYAYSLDVDGGAGELAIINRRGDVSWSRLPAALLEPDAGVGPLSHLGFVAMADGRLVSCGCRSSKLMVLTPRWRRTVPLEVMTTPWLNKW